MVWLPRYLGFSSTQNLITNSVLLADRDVLTVIAGCNADGDINKVETIDLTATKQKYSSIKYISEMTRIARAKSFSYYEPYDSKLNLTLPDYPFPNSGAVGGLINGRPLVCGGSFLGQPCLTYSRSSRKWEKIGDLTYARIFAASAVINHNTLVVSGGFTKNGFTSTTELVVNGTKIKFGRDLKHPLVGHCMAALNDTHIFVAGGLKFDSLDRSMNGSVEISMDAYIFNVVTGGCTDLPPMSKGRLVHTCSVIKGRSKNMEVIVTGGIGAKQETMYSTEIYVVAANGWRTGPDLPKPLYGAAGVNFNRTMLVVGGASSALVSTSSGSHDIYEFNIYDDVWDVRKEKLKYDRSAMVAVVAPKALFQDPENDGVHGDEEDLANAHIDVEDPKFDMLKDQFHKELLDLFGPGRLARRNSRKTLWF